MIRFILADLREHWLGSVVVVLIVALAVALGVAVTLEERALRLGSARAADKFDLVIGAAGSENQLVLSSVFLQPAPLPLIDGTVLPRLTSDPRVAWAAPIGFGDSFSGYPIVGTTTSLVDNLSGGLAEGELFAREGEAVIGASVALKLGDVIKPMHGSAGEGGHTHGELAYRAVGRLKATGTAWDRAILVPIQAVWDIHGMRHDADEHQGGREDEHDHGAVDPNAPINESWGIEVPGVPAILVKPRTIADAYKLRQEFRQGATLAVFPAEVLTRLYATLGDAKRVLFAVAVGSQALIAASLLLVTIMHIGQRRKQIGALRAFGASRNALFSIVWLQLFALVAMGISTGFAIGYGAAIVISRMVADGSGVNVPVDFAPDDIRLAVVLLAFAAALSALPAILTYRQPPATALRG
ncbi:ABC transporter permease [Ensifer sp. MJa1]|uniref:ABC transporter permease n=1 Tax=Ensifer sp. MJa1 TaxID=2919888 RepID=UPI00300A14C3